jgi:hypothetical protein
LQGELISEYQYMSILWVCIAATTVFGLVIDAVTDVNFGCGSGFQNTSFKYLQNVLLVHNQKDSDALATQSELMATGAFAKIDTFNAAATNPSASYLLSYNAALVVISGFSGLPLGAGLGNLLADYWNAGGIVVLTYSAFADENVKGTFGSLQNGYKLMTTTASSEVGGSDTLGLVSESTSPIMTGVKTLSVPSAWRSNVRTVSTGSVVVAYWGNGQLLAIRGKKNNRNIVTLNLFVPTGAETWTGDGMLLIRNALLFSACGKILFITREDLSKPGILKRLGYRRARKRVSDRLESERANEKG